MLVSGNLQIECQIEIEMSPNIDPNQKHNTKFDILHKICLIRCFIIIEYIHIRKIATCDHPGIALQNYSHRDFVYDIP